MADDVLYRTESEIQYLKSKQNAMNKFSESVNFYHEIVPKDEVAIKEEIPPQQDVVPTQQETGDNNPSDPVTIDESKS